MIRWAPQPAVSSPSHLNGYRATADSLDDATPPEIATTRPRGKAGVRWPRKPVISSLAMMLRRPPDDRAVSDSDRMGVGHADRACHRARLVDPRHVGHLSVAVLRVIARRARIARVAPTAGVDGRDAGADVMSFDQRRVADLEPRDVGDGVSRTGPSRERDPERTGVRLTRGCGQMRTGRRHRHAPSRGSSRRGSRRFQARPRWGTIDGPGTVAPARDDTGTRRSGTPKGIRTPDLHLERVAS